MCTAVHMRVCSHMCTLIEHLLQVHGPLMSSVETANVLKYRTVNAMRMAIRRGQLQLKPLPLPGRRGHYFDTATVARTVSTWLA
jgi:hypothetical protein